MNKKNKIIIITGSSGELGFLISKKLISKGFKLVCLIRKNNKKFNQFFKENRKNILAKICCDLLDTKKLTNELNKLNSKIDKIDSIILNAATPHGSIFEMTKIEDMKKIFQINFFSQIYIIQKLLKYLKKSQNPSIINISSISSLIPTRGNLAYGGSKNLLNFFTKILSKELKIYNIKVNALAPTILNNNMGKKTDKTTSKILLKKSNNYKKISMKKVIDKIFYLYSKNGNKLNGKIIKII